MSRSSFSKAYEEMTFTIEDADLDKLNDVLKDINVKECPWFEVQDKHGNKAKYYREPHWIPCSECPEYDFEDVLIRWHDKRKGCEDDYILCEGYVVRKHWCCIFEDADMSDYEPVEWVSISQRRNNVSEFNQQRCHSQKRASV